MTKSLKLHLGKKDNAFIQTVKYIKKEVGAVDTRIKAEAKSIAIRNAILGGSIGIVAGIVGTVLWQKYMTPPEIAPSSTLPRPGA